MDKVETFTSGFGLFDNENWTPEVSTLLEGFQRRGDRDTDKKKIKQVTT